VPHFAPLSNNEFENPRFRLYRSVGGDFYSEYKVASYSIYDLSTERMDKLRHSSGYTDTHYTTRLQMVHPYEQTRGYLRRVLQAPANRDTDGTQLEVDTKQGGFEIFRFFTPVNTKDMFLFSNNVLNKTLLQISDNERVL
jgi:hypothetical protein